MRFNAVSSFSIATLIVSFLISPHVFSQHEKIPADVLELHPKGYVGADYPGIFEDIESDGLTFETWIYLTERLKERPNGLVPDGQWLIFAKSGSYYATISDRTLTDGLNRARPEGKELRYAEDGSIRPERRRFQADASTIALWHFDEGRFAPRYADASGNSYTLIAGGSLAGHVVGPRGKLDIAWGSLKQGAF